MQFVPGNFDLAVKGWRSSLSLVAYPVVTFIPIAGRGSSKAFSRVGELAGTGHIFIVVCLINN